ncbi:MAG: hypothetical protein ACK56F_18835, partial [bacterium]
MDEGVRGESIGKCRRACQLRRVRARRTLGDRARVAHREAWASLLRGARALSEGDAPTPREGDGEATGEPSGNHPGIPVVPPPPLGGVIHTYLAYD